MGTILVVDDDDKKISEVVQLLKTAGASPSNIDVAKTGIIARDKLASRSYDFLILDILIPYRSGDTPDKKGGLNLLSEMIEGTTLHKATHVLALTGYDDLKSEFSAKYNQAQWNVDLYQPGDVGWAERLVARTHYILKELQQRGDQHEVDLCVITALETPELDAIRKLGWRWEKASAFDDVSFYYRGKYKSGEKDFSVAAVAAPRMGMVAAATLATKLIMEIRPQLLCTIGICAGVEGETTIGDCLVASPSWDWQMGKFLKSEFEQAPDQISLVLEIEQRFVLLKKNAELMWQLIQNCSEVKPASHVPEIKIGPVASGSGVLADQNILEQIRSQHRKLLGIDMEIYGVFSAARDSAAKNRPRAFAIKSVCDFANQFKNTKYQGFASYMSANVMRAFAETFTHELIEPCR